MLQEPREEPVGPYGHISQIPALANRQEVRSQSFPRDLTSNFASLTNKVANLEMAVSKLQKWHSTSSESLTSQQPEDCSESEDRENLSSPESYSDYEDFLQKVTSYQSNYDFHSLSDAKYLSLKVGCGRNSIFGCNSI